MKRNIGLSVWGQNNCSYNILLRLREWIKDQSVKKHFDDDKCFYNGVDDSCFGDVDDDDGDNDDDVGDDIFHTAQ